MMRWLAPFAAIVAWELAAKASRGRVPTPSELIRRWEHAQPVVCHFLEPCRACPYRRPVHLVPRAAASRGWKPRLA